MSFVLTERLWISRFRDIAFVGPTIGDEDISRLRLRLRLQVQTATNKDFVVEENKIYTYNAVCQFFWLAELGYGELFINVVSTINL